MIKSICLNHSERSPLGITETRFDRREWDCSGVWVNVAIDRVISDRSKDRFTVAIFNYDDGSSDAVWQEAADKGTRRVTWRHDRDRLNSDGERPSTAGEMKRLVKSHIE